MPMCRAINSNATDTTLWWLKLLPEFSFPALTVLLDILFHCNYLSFICSIYLFIDQTFKDCYVPGRHWHHRGDWESEDEVLVHE